MNMKLFEIYTKRKIYVDLDDIRGTWISKQKGTQREKVAFLRKICKKERIMNFYDLGANYGEFSVGLQDVVHNVYSFEPNKNVASCLKETALLYNNITVYDTAISTDNKDKILHYNEKYSGGGRLEKNWSWTDERYKEYNSEKYFKKQKVKCTDFLKFLQRTHKSGTPMIKIDIEGSEMLIIDHIKEYLAGQEKWFVYFESDKTIFNETDLPGQVLARHATDCLIGAI